MESSRKDYLLEQYRQGVLHTEIHNPTASAMPARVLDTTPQFAERKLDASSVLVNTTHATIFALPARQLESPAPTLHSNVPIAKVHTKPTPPPARVSLISTKHPRQQSHPQHCDHLPPRNPSLMCAQPLSPSTHQTIRFIQHNTAKSTNVMHTLLHLTHQTTDIIYIQEP